MKNETVIFDTIVPHPAPVQISELLAEIEAVIKRHVVLNAHAAAALAVWVLHTYTFELRDTVAYVAVESPEKRCGKTTLLSVLAAMSSKPLIASNITVGALFRAINTCSPTLLIDEADTFLAGNGTMRGIINSGNTRRTAYVLRLSRSKQNQPQPGPQPPVENSETEPGRASLPRRLPPQPPLETNNTGLKRYSCWCPKVIAMIGEAPDTIADRSIVVKMARKLTTETCAPLSALNTAEIRAKCARFALDLQDSIAQSPKICSAGLNDRAADTFDPLYVIARHAGSGWEEKLHAAALALSATADSKNSGSGLILDILAIIVESGEEKIFTRDLVTRLRDGGMKSHALKYSAINEQQIALILRHYGIRPVTMRKGAEVRNGYVGCDFREAMERYVLKEDVAVTVQAIQNRIQLHVEAQAEAQKQAALVQQEAALIDQVLARAPKNRIMSVSETMSVIQELRNRPKIS